MDRVVEKDGQQFRFALEFAADAERDHKVGRERLQLAIPLFRRLIEVASQILAHSQGRRSGSSEKAATNDTNSHECVGRPANYFVKFVEFVAAFEWSDFRQHAQLFMSLCIRML